MLIVKNQKSNVTVKSPCNPALWNIALVVNFFFQPLQEPAPLSTRPSFTVWVRHLPWLFLSEMGP